MNARAMAKRFTPLLAAATSLMLCGPVRANPPAASDRAEALFGKAKSLMDGGDLADACPLFAESYALDPQVGPLLNLAACYEALGRTASAWSLWKKGADLAQARDESERAAFARYRERALEPHLLHLTITVAAQAAQERIALTLDHTPVAREDWGFTLPADPGEHELEARGTGLRPWSSRFVVAQAHVPFVVVPVLEPAPAATEPERRRSALMPVAWTVGGIGLAALGVGTVLGASAIINKNESTDNRNCVFNDCNPTGARALSRAAQDVRIADVSFAVGAGALVTAAALWLLARPEPARTLRAAQVLVAPAVAKDVWALGVNGAW
jgi:hypothetical protein